MKPRSISEISNNMKRIKNKDTKIEILLRNELWKRGIHYRKNCNKVFGHPDIALLGLKIAIFCDSEFWHGFDWENRKNDIKVNRDFWISKIERNINRDMIVTETLKNQGWYVIRFYGKDILRNTSQCADKVERTINERKNSIN